MNVELTPDQRAFVQKAIESGRFKREEQAVEEALAPEPLSTSLQQFGEEGEGQW